MGNRAHVIFTDSSGINISPAVYLHWNGGPGSVYSFLAELDRREVRGDQHYEAARFVAIVAEFFDQDHYTSLSLGLDNGPRRITPKDLEPFDHGDNGVYVVTRDGDETRMRRFTAQWNGDVRTLKEWAPAQVARERAEALKAGDGIASLFRSKLTEEQWRKSERAA